MRLYTLLMMALTGLNDSGLRMSVILWVAAELHPVQ